MNNINNNNNTSNHRRHNSSIVKNLLSKSARSSTSIIEHSSRGSHGVSGCEININLIRGRDLVAKDRHWLTRKKTTSDPYVKVYINDRLRGVSPTINETLNPEWNKSFKIVLQNKEANELYTKFQQSQNYSSSMNPNLMEAPQFMFAIYDYDVLTDDDNMGIVKGDIPFAEKPTKKWYKVVNGEGVFASKNATGEIEVEISVQFKTLFFASNPGESVSLDGNAIVEICLDWKRKCIINSGDRDKIKYDDKDKIICEDEDKIHHKDEGEIDDTDNECGENVNNDNEKENISNDNEKENINNNDDKENISNDNECGEKVNNDNEEDISNDNEKENINIDKESINNDDKENIKTDDKENINNDEDQNIKNGEEECINNDEDQNINKHDEDQNINKNDEKESINSNNDKENVYNRGEENIEIIYVEKENSNDEDDNISKNDEDDNINNNDEKENISNSNEEENIKSNNEEENISSNDDIENLERMKTKLSTEIINNNDTQSINNNEKKDNNHEDENIKYYDQENNLDLDLSCVAVDIFGNIKTDESVYFDSNVTTNGSLRHSIDEDKGGGLIGEVITCKLSSIKKEIKILYFVLNVSTPEKSFKDVYDAQVTVIKDSDRSVLCTINPCIDEDHTGFILMRLSRNEKKHGSYHKMNAIGNVNNWKLTVIGDIDYSARDFGSLIPEIKAYSRDLIPSIICDPNERMSVAKKDSCVRLSEYIQAIPNKLTFGVAWTISRGKKEDLHTYAICLDADYELIEIISRENIASIDNAIHHNRNQHNGEKYTDDEEIHIYLNLLKTSIKYIAFAVISADSNTTFGAVNKVRCHLFDSESNKDRRDLVKYNLSNLDECRGAIMACLYRDSLRVTVAEDLENDSVGVEADEPWSLRTIAEGGDGCTPYYFAKVLKDFLQRNPPLEPSKTEMRRSLIGRSVHNELPCIVEMPGIQNVPSHELFT